ncbi:MULTISPECIES: phage tail protein [Streptomyces]|uniref:Phage tail protein n=1 Tax=Streptomyces lycii TaxID=2654337 RepID=A0ABQ7FB12_9ACTN|nr:MULTISPECIES: phage tail protein [Streptomyces]KAF4406136.1 phage tail protein [Streptomyces lycii]PGH49111.1 phage tail protein [Streptomyces sp. Ru87]
MSLPNPDDALVALNFGIQIDGVMVEYLQKVEGLVIEQDVIEFSQNSGQGIYTTSKMPGAQKAGQVTVTRGMTDSGAFTEWINDSIQGNMSSARKNATIIMMDYEDNPVKRFNMRNAWCPKVEISPVTAGEASVLTETVTITFEELVIE